MEDNYIVKFAFRRHIYDAVEKHFGLEYLEWAQDWEVIHAKAELLPQLLSDYKLFEGQERLAVASLLVASYDHFDLNFPDDPYGPEITKVLKSDWPTYRCLVHYWGNIEHREDPECDGFNITPFMRTIWDSIETSPPARLTVNV